MADAIFNQPANSAPPLDVVLLWLTTTVERDLEERGAFPRLRHAHAKAFRGAATLHYLSVDEASAVLEDATAREKQVRGSVRNAYLAHIRGVLAAMTEAAERPGIFAAAGALCVLKNERAERWRGTKDQLKAHGIRLDGPWPHEPGGRTRWAQAQDSRGYRVNITRFSHVWPGLYDVYVYIPSRDWLPREPSAKDVDEAKRSLAYMPKSAEDFRERLVDSMRAMVRCCLNPALKPSAWHGYMLDEDAAGEIHAGFDAVVEAVVSAQVRFDSARHAEIAQKHRAQIATADQAFQAQFEALVRPNPQILEGGTQ